MLKIVKIFTFTILFLLNNLLLSAEKEATIYVIDIKKEIDHTTWLYLKNGLTEADSLKADAVIIHMNTYGGLVEAADSMRTAILYNPIPVSVFIDNNAASAGALISIAARNIFMRKGANIGAATVVNQTGAAMPDKYQSYMRSMIRSTAEAHGKETIIQGNDTTFRWKRDPAIAEAMVDDRVVIPNLIDTGKVLTFTAEEAVQWGYCDGIVESIDEVVHTLGYTDYEIRKYTPSWFDHLKGFLLSPILQSLLIIIIIGGIYFEMQTPGIGFPSAAAIIAAILYFAPLYIDGLAQNWEILLFIIGVILIFVEIFVLPGFGVAGISGIICIITGLTTALLNNTDFNFEGVTNAEVGNATLTVLTSLMLSIVLIIWLSNKIGSRGILNKMALHTDLEDAISVPDISGLIGKTGTTATVLRPSGKVILEEEIYDAVSESGFIEKDKEVKVSRVENAQVYVYEIR